MDDLHDLIEQLFVVAAGYMEDAATAMVLQADRSVVERMTIAKDAARRITAIGSALEVLCDSGPRPGV